MIYLYKYVSLYTLHTDYKHHNIYAWLKLHIHQGSLNVYLLTERPTTNIRQPNRKTMFFSSWKENIIPAQTLQFITGPHIQKHVPIN